MASGEWRGRGAFVLLATRHSPLATRSAQHSGQFGQRGTGRFTLFSEPSANGLTERGFGPRRGNQLGRDPDQDLEGSLGTVIEPLAPQHPGASTRGTLSEFRQQTCLAAAGFGLQQYQAPFAACGPPHLQVEQFQFRTSAHETPVRSRFCGGRPDRPRAADRRFLVRELRRFV